MPSLQVRELPERIFHRLQSEAQKEHRSFSQQAVVTLARGLNLAENPKKRRADLLRNILNNPVVPDSSDLTNPVELLRKDRER